MRNGFHLVRHRVLNFRVSRRGDTRTTGGGVGSAFQSLARNPPSTGKTTPVIHDAASLASSKKHEGCSGAIRYWLEQKYPRVPSSDDLDLSSEFEKL